MHGAMSKRQQARHERTLQDLIRTVPGNDRCADCAAKNPGWASWNLGIFLCMRCAAIHRKLGTHISKVKSLSMDTWSTEQVENMRNVGNITNNKIYNPRQIRPDVPIDVDEVDTAIERFIRQKYDARTLSKMSAPTTSLGQTTTRAAADQGSWNEEAPELPPKPLKKLGFSIRSSSSTFPRGKPERSTPPLSSAYSAGDVSLETSIKQDNKPGRLFGMRITTVENNFHTKLTHLRDMGFADNSRNTEILKTMNGNLEKAVEELVRLGENTRPVSTIATPAPKAQSPVSMQSSGVNGVSAGKNIQDPWEVREEPKTGSRRPASVPPPATATASNAWNPFLQPSQTQPSTGLEDGLQGMSISATSSPGPQISNQQQAYYSSNASNLPNNPWRASQPPQTYPAPSQQYDNTQSYMHQQQQVPITGQNIQTTNPFMPSAPPSRPVSLTNPWSQQGLHQQVASSQPNRNSMGNPWQQQSLYQQQFSASPQPIYGQQEDFFSQPQQTSTQMSQLQQHGSPNPWSQQPGVVSQQQFPSTQSAQQVQYSQHGRQLAFQAPRQDNPSILAMYNYPQFAPLQSLQSLPENGVISQQLEPDTSYRSASRPVSTIVGSMNPFLQASAQSLANTHASKESVDFQGFANSGRHSPDAFSSLSARYTR